jgi:hypothetical protein
MVILISFIREISYNNNNNNNLGVPVKNYEPQSRWPATSGVNPVSPPVRCAKQSIDFKKQQRGRGADRREGSFGHSSN